MSFISCLFFLFVSNEKKMDNINISNFYKKTYTIT